jgi:DNA-3-methyladenine glycosylase II
LHWPARAACELLSVIPSARSFGPSSSSSWRGGRLAVPDETLRAAGLSANKLASIRDLSQQVAAGEVDVAGLVDLDDEDVISRLTAVRGIGRWTAEMFLLFELRRPDVWPVGDLGVRYGYSLIFALPEAPAARDLEAMGERFRPYRSVAAWYCWEAVHMKRAGTL